MSDDQNLIVTYAEDINEATKPEPLPAGDYEFEIREVKREVSQKGMACAVPIYFISYAQYPADFIDGDPDGTNLRGFVSLADDKNARFRMKTFCAAIGAPVSNQVDMSEWIRCTGIVTVEHRMYEGEPQANAKKISAIQ